jgi:hypothetical protein
MSVSIARAAALMADRRAFRLVRAFATIKDKELAARLARMVEQIAQAPTVRSPKRRPT